MFERPVSFLSHSLRLLIICIIVLEVFWNIAAAGSLLKIFLFFSVSFRNTAALQWQVVPTGTVQLDLNIFSNFIAFNVYSLKISVYYTVYFSFLRPLDDSINWCDCCKIEISVGMHLIRPIATSG